MGLDSFATAAPAAMPWALLFVAACLGASVGSFLNVCIYRLPRQGLGIGSPSRSFCPLCGSRIAWADNIPVVSWWLLGGSCRRCRAPISLRYPAVETLTAVVFAVVTYRVHVEVGASSAGTLAVLALVSMLIAGAWIDIDLRILPDAITVGGMHVLLPLMLLLPDLRLGTADPAVSRLLAGLESGLSPLRDALPPALRSGIGGLAVFACGVVALFPAGCSAYKLYRRLRLPDEPRRFRDVALAGLLAAAGGGLVLAVLLRPSWSFSPPVHSLAATLLGMLAGSSLVFGVKVVATRIWRKPAMGFGDVKLMGFLGGLTGWSGVLVGFFAACLLGSVFGVVRLVVSRDRYLPFGPFLIAGCLFPYLWPGAVEAVFYWYLAAVSRLF